MKKSLPLLLLFMSIQYFMLGCSSNTPTMKGKYTKNEASPIRFTLISPLAGNPYWNMVEDGMIAADKEFGVDTKYIGPTQLNSDEQIKAIETAIASKVDGIITMASNPEKFTPVINKAVALGIPVVLIDTDAPESKRDIYIGTDNKHAGMDAGNLMIKASNGKAVIGIITASVDQANLNERIQGFEEAIKDQPEMKIATIEHDNSELFSITEKADSMFKTHPDINAVFCAGGYGAVGVGKIIEEQNLTGKVRVVAFDDVPETIKYIKKGVIYGAIVQKPFQMGYLGVKILKEIREGNPVLKTVIDTNVTVVTKENVDTYKNYK